MLTPLCQNPYLFEYPWFKLPCHHVTQELTETTSIHIALLIPISCHPHPSYTMLQTRRLLQFEAKRCFVYSNFGIIHCSHIFRSASKTRLLIIVLMTRAIHLGCITKIIFIDTTENEKKGRCMSGR